MTQYVNSVKNVTVTIANGATTGTNTLSAPVGKYFILWNGYTTTDTSTDASSMPAVTFSNNVITATRGTSSTATITVSLCVVDATSSLIKSVQFGSTALSSGQTSNTSSITAVTNANAAIAYLGQSTTGSQSYSGNQCWVSLSSTTVTVAKEFAGSTETVAWVVIEFQGAALNSSVQNVAQNASQSGTSWTSTITGVTAKNTILIYGGSGGNVTSDPATVFQYGALTNGTTETTNVNTAPSATMIFNFCVVEFKAAVLTGNAVQRGTVALSSATSATATVTKVGTGGVLNFVGNTSTATTANAATARQSITLTNTTTVTASLNTSGSGTSSYELVDFNVGGADAIWFGAIA